VNRSMTLWPMHLVSQLKSIKRDHGVIQRETQIGDPVGQ
jgi:hypothetical protein